MLKGLLDHAKVMMMMMWSVMMMMITTQRTDGQPVNLPGLQVVMCTNKQMKKNR